MSKYTDRNAKADHRQIKKACDKVEFERRIEARYCEVASRQEVTRYASEENRNWRTVPTGYEY